MPGAERLSLCPAGHTQHHPFNLGPVLKMSCVLCCLAGVGRDEEDPDPLRLQEGLGWGRCWWRAPVRQLHLAEWTGVLTASPGEGRDMHKGTGR